MSTNRRILVSGATLLALVCAGCFGTPPKEEHFYFLTGPSKIKALAGAPRIGVADLTVAPGYNSERLAYRLGDNHLRYYGYRQWVSQPSQMLTDMTVRQLAASGLFSEIAPAEKVREPDGILEGHVIAIEEVDEPDKGRWHARLAIAFTLRGERSEKVLLRHNFDITRPCAKRDPADVARLLSKIFHGELLRLGRRMARRLTKIAKQQARQESE